MGMISVIIPAHNEEQVIGRTLGALSGASGAGEVEIIVVCNGCRDRTAEVARQSGAGVRVIETEVASKANALNLGDQAACGFPRFYVDADVVLPLEAVQEMARRLGEGRVLAVAPRFRMELDRCSWAVRAFYEINDRLPSSSEGIGGSGVYGLSEAGRRRFEQFPPLTADDGFIRLQFSPAEREAVPGCYSTVFAPKTLWELIAIKTRSHYGTMELRRRLPQLWQNVGERNGRALARLAVREPWLWPKLAVYTYVKTRARMRARRQLSAGGAVKWERDESSRQATHTN
jgi:glycosyltransferase involved in cell wall biosynthesis